MDETHVSGAPTKAFFIQTITKDISLEDCILDLIDNSLDGATRQLGHPRPKLSDGEDLSKFRVDITISPSEFRIVDNCGGISLNDAVNYAFTFGRVDDDKPEEFSIGLYGIGMKRAIFKMGRSISIRSRFDGSKKEPATSFNVPIDVPKWRASKSWDFDLEDTEELKHPGVSLDITNIYDHVAVEFSNTSFVNHLRSIIARDYSQFLDKGFRIFVNSRPVVPFVFNFLVGDKIKPYRSEFKLHGVSIEIVAGLAAKPSEAIDPDEGGLTEDRSGWYVICNGRIVLAADKSELTGWGYQGRTRWHPQYRGFVGLIMFTAKDASALPLTTTKRSIDRDRETYRLALVRMMELTRVWTEYTNTRKTSLAEAKGLEDAAQSKPLAAIEKSTALSFPTFSARRPATKETTIQYPKPPDKIRSLAVAFGDATLSAREVGVRSFDYAFKELGAGSL